MPTSSSRIERLTEALIDASESVDRDRALLGAAEELCGAAWCETWCRVVDEDGPAWWPTLARGESDATPPRALVRETLAGRFSGGLPGQSFALCEGDYALVIGEAQTGEENLDLLGGLLILRAALDAPILDLVEAPAGLAQVQDWDRTRFSVQATRALLAPETPLIIDGEPDGTELEVGADGFAALLLDLGSAVSVAGADGTLRISTSYRNGQGQLELVAQVSGDLESCSLRVDDVIARARRLDVDAERVEDHGCTTLTLRLPIVSPKAA